MILEEGNAVENNLEILDSFNPLLIKIFLIAIIRLDRLFKILVLIL